VPATDTLPKPAVWKTILAFAIIYIIWGSTFLAIRIGVRELSPLLFAALRFLVASLVLVGWTLAKREPLPTRRQWLTILLLALLIFLVDYGCLFWAEQRVPSGIAAVMMATIPVFTALFEILFLRTQRLTVRLALALTIGLLGVAVLMSRSFNLGGAPIDTLGAIALIVGSISWSLASILTRRLPLPPSKLMSSGTQMLAGGVMLTFAAAAHGELRTFTPSQVSNAAWLSLLYLIIAGSLIGFTAYVWLIQHQSPTKVGTYAYVNPLVAVLLGCLVAGEPFGIRTILGAACVLISVIILTTKRSTQPTAKKAT